VLITMLRIGRPRARVRSSVSLALRLLLRTTVPLGSLVLGHGVESFEWLLSQPPGLDAAWVDVRLGAWVGRWSRASTGIFRGEHSGAHAPAGGDTSSRRDGKL